MSGGVYLKMSESSDILGEISNEDLPKLAKIYEKHVHWAPQVLSLIRTGMRWKKNQKYSNCMRFLSPDNSWQTDGTIIVLMQFHCYDIFVFTLDDQCSNLYQGLILTKLIDYKNPLATFFCVDERFIPTVKRVIDYKKLKASMADRPFLAYTLPPQKANFKIDCPDDVYVKRLEPHLADQINSLWPHKFAGSRDYLATLIEMNGGYGLFLKSTNEMVSWIVKHCFGHMGMLQTEEKYKRRGYGMIVHKYLIKDIVKEGNWPFGTIYADNKASIGLTEKLGLEKIGTCTYIGIKND